MPYAFKRPCRSCGIAMERHKSGLCEECRHRLQRAQEAYRGTSRQRGYTAAWEKLRREILIRDKFTCASCGWQPEIVKIALENNVPIPIDVVFADLKQRFRKNQIHLVVDHKISIARAPQLRLVRANLQILCAPKCHGAKTMRELQSGERGGTTEGRVGCY